MEECTARMLLFTVKSGRSFFAIQLQQCLRGVETDIPQQFVLDLFSSIFYTATTRQKFEAVCSIAERLLA